MVLVRRRKSVFASPPLLRQVAILFLKLLALLLCGACVRFPWTTTNWGADTAIIYPSTRSWDGLLLGLTPSFLLSNGTTAAIATTNLLSPDHVWTYDDIDVVLKCNSRDIVEKSIQQYQTLLERAKHMALNENKTIYGTSQSPLFGFLIPKTGSNTQEYYQLEALAAISQLSYTGCSNEGIANKMYDCMRTSSQHKHKLCTAGAFGNHFEPDRLLYELWHANCTESSSSLFDRQHPTTTSTYRDEDLRSQYRNTLSNRSVCTMVFRDPLERTLAGFYEWHYLKTTNYTALEFVLEQQRDKAISFPMPQSQLDWIQMSYEKGGNSGFSLLDAVLTSCLIGVTEHMSDYVTALSRVLWIEPPLSQQHDGTYRARSRQRYGMYNESDYNLFRLLLLPQLNVAEVALWQLATRVSQAQYQVSLQYKQVIPNWLIPHLRRSSIDGDCTNCTRCTPPGYERFRWTSYKRFHTIPAPQTRVQMTTTLPEGGEAILQQESNTTAQAVASEVCIGPQIRVSPNGLHCCAHDYGQ